MLFVVLTANDGHEREIAREVSERITSRVGDPRDSARNTASQPLTELVRPFRPPMPKRHGLSPVDEGRRRDHTTNGSEW